MKNWPAPCVLSLTYVSVPVHSTVYGVGLNEVNTKVPCKVLAK